MDLCDSKKLLAVTDEIAKCRSAIMAKKRIGILTGGGDVPGLNSVIKTVTYRSSEDDIEVVGLRRGWEGLTHLNPDDPASRRRYELVPIPDPKLGPRSLDVATMYNTERYRPMYANKRGLPVF
jgi:6-phosphofructokinase 1